MVACANIGLRYVWIDQVCIDQSNSREKSQQINQMGLIYGPATCTFVALAGKDSSYGLPGVTLPRHWNFSKVKIGNLNLVDQAPSFSQCFNQNSWTTRGWTFQEFLCSFRLLFFSEFGVHFVHREPTGIFEIQSEASSVFSYPGSFPSPDEYWSALEQYTARDLRYSSDIIPAISGILNTIHGNETEWGMPLRNINQAMTWYAVNGHPNEKKRPGYPSWSWTSHCGTIRHLLGCVGLAF